MSSKDQINAERKLNHIKGATNLPKRDYNCSGYVRIWVSRVCGVKEPREAPRSLHVDKSLLRYFIFSCMITPPFNSQPSAMMIRSRSLIQTIKYFIFCLKQNPQNLTIVVLNLKNCSANWKIQLLSSQVEREERCNQSKIWNQFHMRVSTL